MILGDLCGAAERSLCRRAKFVKIKFSSLFMGFLCNFKMGGCGSLEVTVGNPISIES